MTVEVGNYLNVHRQALGKYLNADTGVDHPEHVPLGDLGGGFGGCHGVLPLVVDGGRALLARLVRLGVPPGAQV